MKQIRHSMWSIALPVLLNMLVSQLQVIIDRAFLGQLSPDYMSALGNVGAPLWTSLSIIWALTTGATILASQAIGAKNPATASDIAHSTLKYSSIFSVVLFMLWLTGAETIFSVMGVREPILGYCITYLRLVSPLILFTGIGAACSSVLQSSGYTLPILISGIVRSGLNVVLDWIMIYGKFGFPAMGLEGAAVATSIAETMGVLVLIGLMSTSKKLAFPLSLKTLVKAKLGNFVKVVRLGIPSSAEEFLWNFGQLGLIRMLNAIDGLAAGIYTIIFSVDIIPALSFMALGQATLTLTGRKTGEKDFGSARKIGTMALRHSWLISLVFAAAFFLFPSGILGIFTSDPDIVSGSKILLFIAALNFFPRSANIALGSGIRGYGDTRWMMNTQIFGTAFVLATSAFFLFVLKTGITGVFLTIILDETLRGLINYLRYRKGPIMRNIPLEEGTTAA